jgi:hypothetical protein
MGTVRVPVVAFLAGSLVQLSPERLRLPAQQVSLQLRVEVRDLKQEFKILQVVHNTKKNYRQS